MLHFMPPGWFGLMVGGLIAASSSTLLTHLNWGSSYLVHDCYRRFVKVDGTERHYVNMGRLSTVGLFVVAACLTPLLGTAAGAFHLIVQVGAGTGLLYLVRWFWWRVSAWSEVAAMASSFLISSAFLVADQAGGPGPTSLVHDQTFQLVATIVFTTVCWVTTALVAPGTDAQTLVRFYLTVRPAGPGWAPVRRQAAVAAHHDESSPDDMPLALVGWVSGVVTVWSGLFTVGNVLYGRWGYTALMAGVLAGSGGVLIAVVRRLWATGPAVTEPSDAPPDDAVRDAVRDAVAAAAAG